MTTRLGEFELIDHFFASKTLKRPEVLVGIGDDAAVVSVPADHDLILAIDTITVGRHFLASAPPDSIAHRALAVNLSDCAAMSANPAWFTLALCIPTADPDWLQGFSEGLTALAQRYSVQCIGGDTTQGPLTVSIQIHGFVPKGKAVLRSGAKVGDKILVTGTLGGAAYALQQIQQGHEPDPKGLQQSLYPQPQIEAGLVLREFATSMIDISDGLAGDLQHILTASQVGAILHCETLPLDLPQIAWHLALTGGDDYQLCFTVAPHQEAPCRLALQNIGVSATTIGEITMGSELTLLNHQTPVSLPELGFEHFRE